jgi:uncharacterized delta-60 repeat protein
MRKSYLVRTIILAGSLLLQLSTLCFYARGAAGDVDPSFDPGSGINGPVYSLVVQPDGKVIIGGQFTTVNGLLRANLARLNADGSGDTTFDPGLIVKGPVSSVALHVSNKVLFAASFGSFTEPYSYEDYQVARLNSDGSLDNYAFFQRPWEERYGGDINSIFVQSNGKVMLGGYFLVEGPDGAGGGALYPYPRITRINADGSEDGSFEYGYNLDYGGSIESVAVQPDGKVLVGGGFFIGTNFCTFARLNTDGSMDNGFSPNVVNGVLSIALQSDGKVLVGGYIYTVNGTYLSGIARLNANGSLDSSFNPGTGANGLVRSIAVQPDGKVLIGGDFTTFNGPNRNHIARLNANGSLDLSFNPGTGANGNVSSIALQPDGNILIGGDFTTVNGVVRPRVARLYGAAPFFLSHVSVVSNHFGFDVTGDSNSVIIVEASTNLVNWTALATNTLVGVPLHFSDPGWTNFQKRFYRARLVP